MGKLEPLRELRRLGASYDIRDYTGSTALHWATISKNPELVDWMLEDGADVSVVNDIGRTPLMQLGTKDCFPTCILFLSVDFQPVVHKYCIYWSLVQMN